MKRNLLLHLFTFISLTVLSQSNDEIHKECRIKSGLGLAGATTNTKKPGADFWLQIDYKFAKDFSLATEFENMNYKQPGYFKDLPVNPNEIKTIDNNFSLLLKYYFPIKSAIKIAVSSGWTFAIRQSDYFIITRDSTSTEWFSNVSSFSDYRIPFLLEVAYPVLKRVDIEARAKYNLNPQNGSTCSAGIGLSLKL